MPNQNAVVSLTFRINPPLDRAPVEMLRAERGLSVELEGGRTVRLDPQNPRSVGFAQVLDGLSKQGLPVYLEIDPDTEAITRILIPYVARVINVTPSEGALDVELDNSHARHVLELGKPDSAGLERQLREAFASGRPLIVTEDDAHRIIDIRDFTPDKPDKEDLLPPFPPGRLKEEPPRRYWWPWSWIRCLLHWCHCLSMTKAQQVFNAMAATSCDPLTIPPPCIPFLYPDDGCWGRAHEMCRLMINMGLSPRKIWIDHSFGHFLHVNTRNNPQCFVEWGWHVAPILCVRGPKLFQTQSMVIDPSLFTTPVTEATWKGVQGDPGATLTHTGPEVFSHGGGVDATYTAQNAVLATYRLALQNRSNQVGPPPYANCP
jgi:hypothetical protein